MIWNPNPIAFEIFGLSIAWYGLTWSVAILVGYFLLLYIFKKENKDQNKLVPYIQYIFVGVLIGARLFEMLYYQFDSFISDPTLFFRFRDGGLASHGAMLGTVLSIYFFVKRNKDFSFWWLFDRSVIVVIIQGAVIRFGNFLNSELYGKISDVPWSVKFLQVDNNFRHPVQLYEAFWLLFCFALFFYLYHKLKSFKNGFFVALFLIIVLGGRVFLEFFKEAETVFFVFSQTQLISVLSVFIGLLLMYVLNKKLN